MRLDSNNPWLTKPKHSALVSLGTHSLWASIAGPIRLPNAPLVVFFAGGGAPCALYIKLFQQLSQHVRVFFHDRGGHDKSTLPPPKEGEDNGVYAQDIARDLVDLLSITQLKPPYIPVGHSYGGIPARCFFSLDPCAMAGMMLLDCATEMMLALHPRVPPVEFNIIAEDVDYEKATHFIEESGMTEEEWKYALGAVERCAEGVKRQDTHTSATRLANEFQIDNQAMGSKPLTVLRFHATHDLQVIYDAGVKLGNGTEEQRAAAQAFIDKFGLYHEQLQRATCRLSRNTSFAYYGECGHDLPMRRPAIVVNEMKRLLERIEASH
jgi:pimeloyl-ACP methyl ester carboxylesterase